MKKIRYAFEALFVWIVFQIFRFLPARTASNLGGFIGRTIGPHLAVNRKALRNVEMALPHYEPAYYKKICAGMWDNLGRVIAEYPHLAGIGADYTTLVGLDNIEHYIENRQPIIYFSGHFANWEMNATGPLVQRDIMLDLTFREPNNPWTAKILEKARTLNGRIKAYPKSSESGRIILKALRQGRSLGILIDQKYNEGLNVPFMGHPAMTNPIFVILAQKYNCPLIPARVVREQGHRFRVIIYPEIPVFDASGMARPVPDVIADAHTLLEQWIKEKPEQWMWLHRRWKS